MGDSLSAAYGIDVSRAWPALLQKRLERENYHYQIINMSVSGYTTSNGLSVLPDALKRYQPNITLIALGANDGLRGLDISIIKNNLSKMIVLAKDANSKVLLIGIRLPPNYGISYTLAFQTIFLDLAKKHQISLIPLMLKNIDENSAMFQADRLHPAVGAQETIVNNIWPVLQSLL